tara:strand:- start:101 stop:430 length:330 start_codon:yes stop_codon:yes gene_type:complete
MIIEKRTYSLRPGGVAQYMEIYKKYGLQIQTKILGGLVGWFHPEFGELNQIVHMWAYKSLSERTRRRAKLHRTKEWQTYLAKQREAELIVKQDSQILTPAPWSPVPTIK